MICQNTTSSLNQVTRACYIQLISNAVILRDHSRAVLSDHPVETKSQFYSLSNSRARANQGPVAVYMSRRYNGQKFNSRAWIEIRKSETLCHHLPHFQVTKVGLRATSIICLSLAKSFDLDLSIPMKIIKLVKSVKFGIRCCARLRIQKLVSKQISELRTPRRGDVCTVVDVGRNWNKSWMQPFLYSLIGLK